MTDEAPVVQEAFSSRSWSPLSPDQPMTNTNTPARIAAAAKNSAAYCWMSTGLDAGAARRRTRSRPGPMPFTAPSTTLWSMFS